MIEISLFGLGLLLLMAAWKFMLRPAMLDAARDSLFDLRDAVRERFAARQDGLSDPAYRALRDLLNGHLRHTEAVTFLRVVFSFIWQSEHKEAISAIHRHLDSLIEGQDQEMMAFMKDVRVKASLVVIDYAIKSSLFGLVCAVLGVSIITLRDVKSRWARAWSPQHRVPGGSFAHVAAWSGILLALSTHVGIGGRDVAQTVMEECALHSDLV